MLSISRSQYTAWHDRPFKLTVALRLANQRMVTAPCQPVHIRHSPQLGAAGGPVLPAQRSRDAAAAPGPSRVHAAAENKLHLGRGGSQAGQHQSLWHGHLGLLQGAIGACSLSVAAGGAGCSCRGGRRGARLQVSRWSNCVLIENKLESNRAGDLSMMRCFRSACFGAHCPDTFDKSSLQLSDGVRLAAADTPFG